MLRKTILGLVSTLAVASSSFASTSYWVTPSGSATSGPVSAEAIFTTSANSLTITVINQNVNPTDSTQAISGLSFTLDNGASTGTFAGSATNTASTTADGTAQQVAVNSGGTFATGATVVTGWGLNQSVGGGFQLDTLAYAGTTGMIIGGPDSTLGYSNGDASIAANSFLFESATFNLAVPTVLDSTQITSASFTFGPTAGANIVMAVDPPPPSSAPEPTTLMLIGLGVAGIGGLVRHKKR